ncbi:MAG TPA: ABC transporter ATP-binding protein [Gemmatimonadales bacterium]|nr:ABC transporter ATP-binding protein [Gemmatimonadales bacterium]
MTVARAMLQLDEATVRYAGSSVPALSQVSLDVGVGELVAVTGPNGSGKTTLLRALLGLVPLGAGTASVLGKRVEAWTRPELARVVGVVTQREETVFPLRVEETVLLGRYARLGPLSPIGDADRRAVSAALDRCDAAHLAARRVDELSGGEWQRVRVARALAQEPRALVLDEPTASLDVRHAMEVFELVAELAAGGLAALLVTHELNLAARFASRILLLDEGRPAALGTPRDVLERERLSRVFRWPLDVSLFGDGSPQVTPLRSAAESGRRAAHRFPLPSEPRIEP